MKRFFTFGAAMLASVAIIAAQTRPLAQPPTEVPAQPQPQAPARVASPPGTAQTQVGGSYTKNEQGRERYTGGKWIEITYGRPIKRGRTVFGTGADYAKLLLINDATVWRAGANVSTRLNTEAPLKIGDKVVPAGEYSLFIDAKSPTDWTLIVSSWGAKKTGNDKTPDTLWGSFNYTPDKDVARVAMKVDRLPMSIDQLTWGFSDVTATGGNLFIMWDNVIATAPFGVAQ